jgi:hypothetical protein
MKPSRPVARATGTLVTGVVGVAAINADCWAPGSYTASRSRLPRRACGVFARRRSALRQRAWAPRTCWPRHASGSVSRPPPPDRTTASMPTSTDSATGSAAAVVVSTSQPSPMTTRSDAAGRVRYEAAWLRGSIARALAVEDEVERVAGVRAVHAYPRTGSIVIWIGEDCPPDHRSWQTQPNDHAKLASARCPSCEPESRPRKL